jgi:hypothetical protein
VARATFPLEVHEVQQVVPRIAHTGRHQQKRSDLHAGAAERLFHGVAALRLNPVGGPRAIYGRSGLLAHTCMLGAGCDSNGCASIRDYAAFLQADRRGEFQRLVVVAGAG